MPGDQTPGRDEIAELRKRVALLEERVARVESGKASAAQPDLAAASRVGSPRSDADLTVATALIRVAMLSFVLLGAFLLRTLTQHGILGPGFGTLLGFAYAGHLIVLSFLPGRLGGLARATSLFQCCGVALSFSIALESSLHTHTLARPTAMAIMAGFAALSLAVASAHRKALLAGTATVGAILALVAMGLIPEGMRLQVTLLVAFGATAAALSWIPGWAFLRLTTLPLLIALLSVGAAIASRESLDCGLILSGAVVLWCAIALQHALAFRALGPAAAWLPTATVWLAGLAWFCARTELPIAAAVVSALATAAAAAAWRSEPESGAGTGGLAWTAALAGAIGWLLLDPTGVICALAGVALWLAMRRTQSPWAAGSTVILPIAAAIRGALPAARASASRHAMLAGEMLAAVILIHYLWTERSRSKTPDGSTSYPSPLVLAAGLFALFATLRGVAHGLFSDPDSSQLAQTSVLAGAAVFLTFIGRIAHRPAVVYSGLTCMVLVLGKVGLVDLLHLSGIRLLASIILVGLSSVGVSLSLRHGA